VRRTLEKLPRTASGALLNNALSFTQEIETQSVRGGDIIRRLMTLLRKTGSHRSAVSLRKLIDEVLFLLATEIRVTQVDVDIAVPEDLPEIIVDAVQIQQVLFNVIRNAIESMAGQSQSRHLWIHAGPECRRAILVRVRDTGPGFSAAMKGQIFTPFATSKPDGLGFGLAITKRIVEAHGGRIDVRSEAGTGAEICFTLPADATVEGDADAQ
jgi:two-component system, LuxR family, sensor kinase FixL